MSKANILGVYNLANRSEHREGRQWYRDALEYAQDIGAMYAVDTPTVVGVISALSPRNKWRRNKADAESLLKVYYAGGNDRDLFEVPVATFNTGKLKAIKLLTEKHVTADSIRAVLRGPKLQEFFNCIYTGTDICIDSHAYCVWLGDRQARVGRISSSLRRDIKDAYLAAADQVGIAGKDLQAVTWLTWRRLHGIS